jgi:integrase
MACIFKRGKTWSYSIDIGKDINGKRRKKTKGGFRTQTEAKRAAAIIAAEVAQNIFIDDSKITFGAYADRWLEIYKNTVKVSTADLRRHHIVVLKKYCGKKHLSQISAEWYQQLVIALAKDGYALKTVNDIHRTASLIFKNACQNKIIKENPAAKAVMPRQDNGIYMPSAQGDLPKYLEKDELQLFLQTAAQKSDWETYVIFSLLAYTGMRIGELTGLQWGDINFLNKEIAINRTLYIKAKGGIKNYILLTPKTRSSKRTITITDNIAALLRRHMTVQREKKLQFRDKWHDGGFVFTSPFFYGYPLPKQTIQQRMKKILAAANLNSTLTPHSLRHTHASLLAEAGVSLESIMERLGHINDDVTRRIYLHITKESKRDAATKFAALLSNM